MGPKFMNRCNINQGPYGPFGGLLGRYILEDLRDQQPEDFSTKVTEQVTRWNDPKNHSVLKNVFFLVGFQLLMIHLIIFFSNPHGFFPTIFPYVFRHVPMSLFTERGKFPPPMTFPWSTGASSFVHPNIPEAVYIYT